VADHNSAGAKADTLARAKEHSDKNETVSKSAVGSFN
jgi:hypothetical protein